MDLGQFNFKKMKNLVLLVLFLFMFQIGYAEKFPVNKKFTETTVLPVSGQDLSITADVKMLSEESSVRFILIDNQNNEYLLYETYPLLDGFKSKAVDAAEETGYSQAVEIRVEVIDSKVNFKSYSDQSPKTKRDKVEKLNKNLRKNGENWIAGETYVSKLSYGQRKKLYGQSNFPDGFEYYVGGIIKAKPDNKTNRGKKPVPDPIPDPDPDPEPEPIPDPIPDPTPIPNPDIKPIPSPNAVYTDKFDWRSRHGINWVTSIKNQSTCGSCWTFAAVGTVEAITNLYYNQKLDLDLSEQQILSCSDGGSCSGGYPYRALDYIKNTGVVDERASVYVGADISCNTGAVTDRIKISGRLNFGSSAYPKSENILKHLIINYGIISGGLSNWAHAMPLVGYQVVKAGDIFYYRDETLKRYWITIQEGDPLIGNTVWIFKNSWGALFGDAGYIYVETPITNIGWTHAITTPVSSLKPYVVKATDNDNDGYYFWGIGRKPAGLVAPDQPDGDDSDPTKGPIDIYGNFIQ